eukprot:s2455_g6.t1
MPVCKASVQHRRCGWPLMWQARPVLAVAGCLAAVLLAGCGDSNKPTPAPGGSTTPGPDTPAGPIDCPADLKRGHCTKCYYSGGSGGQTTCQECSSPYKLTDQTKCVVSCSDMPAPAEKPGMPTNAQSYNGITWPSTCFDEEEIHFFTVGDEALTRCFLLCLRSAACVSLGLVALCASLHWPLPGVCDWNTGKCSDGSNPYAGQYPELKGKPFPMPNRHGAPLQEPVDYMAQNLVASRMKEKAEELKKDGKDPKFVLNVGDNFYPGGVNAHCSDGSPNDAAFTQSQFAQVFEQMYPVEDIGNIEWWSVLGNHDYGGVCYIKGWDQQIFYTYKPNGRWVMPAQYWRRSVQFKTFSVDLYFLDTNILDSFSPDVDPGHNLCSSKSNPGEHCELDKYPVKNGTDGASCSATGPMSPQDCVSWFEKLWSDQKKWFVDAVQKSEADWQIVVMHHPPSYTPGRGESVLHWTLPGRLALTSSSRATSTNRRPPVLVANCSHVETQEKCNSSIGDSKRRAMVLEELPGGYNEKSMTEGLEPREQPEAVKELALRRAEVLLSLENWCQALKNVENLPQAQDAEGEFKESFHEKLQSRLRDALFLDICNVLSFPNSTPKPVTSVTSVTSRAAATTSGTPMKTSSTPTTPVKISSRQISKSAGLMMTPRTSGSGRLTAAPRSTAGALTSREPLTSRRSLNGTLSSVSVASSLTPRRPGGSLCLGLDHGCGLKQGIRLSMIFR